MRGVVSPPVVSLDDLGISVHEWSDVPVYNDTPHLLRGVEGGSLWINASWAKVISCHNMQETEKDDYDVSE